MENIRIRDKHPGYATLPVRLKLRKSHSWEIPDVRTRVSDPDQSGRWIRQKWPQKVGKNYKIPYIEVLDVLFLRAEGFFCTLDVPSGSGSVTNEYGSYLLGYSLLPRKDWRRRERPGRSCSPRSSRCAAAGRPPLPLQAVTGTPLHQSVNQTGNMGNVVTFFALNNFFLRILCRWPNVICCYKIWL